MLKWGLLFWLAIGFVPAAFADDRQEAVNRELDYVDANFGQVTVNVNEGRSKAPVVKAPPAKQEDKGLKNLEDYWDISVQELNPRHVHTLDVGEEIYYYHYRESIEIKNVGMMSGIHAKYAYRPPDGNFLNNVIVNAYMVEGRFATGKLDYKDFGNGPGHGAGSVYNQLNTNYEVRGLLGKDILLKGKSLVTPYVGFGYRYLLDEGNDRFSTNGFLGYDRHSNYYYFPIGVYVSIPAGRWTTNLNLEYDYFYAGKQISELSSTNQYNDPVAIGDIKNPQEHGWGARASVKFIYTGYRLNFYVEPFVRFWSIADSKVVRGDYMLGNVVVQPGQWSEPRNTTVEAGGKLGVQF